MIIDQYLISLDRVGAGDGENYITCMLPNQSCFSWLFSEIGKHKLEVIKDRGPYGTWRK
jgi:hypothetical protein